MMNTLRKQIATWLLLLLGLAGCTSETTPPPHKGEILSRPVMVEMLIETHLAESAAAWKGRKLVDEALLYAHYEQKIMERYQTDTTTFLRSLRHYLSRPKEASRLYQAVYDSMELRIARLYPAASSAQLPAASKLK